MASVELSTIKWKNYVLCFSFIRAAKVLKEEDNLHKGQCIVSEKRTFFSNFCLMKLAVKSIASRDFFAKKTLASQNPKIRDLVGFRIHKK